VVSVEANRRKLEFQRSIVREFSLEGCDLQPHRLQELPPRKADYFVAKAVAKTAQFFEDSSAHLRSGGMLVLPGSTDQKMIDDQTLPSAFEFVSESSYRNPVDHSISKLLLLRRV
jgi:16S rRNA G527 N7-methylase RsmG